jgi:hypothetical protein
MAIDNDNKKLSLITYQQMWNTPLPISSDGIDNNDKLHMLAQYSMMLVFMSGTIGGSSDFSAIFRSPETASGLDEPVKSDFTYPVVPDDVSPDVAKFLLALRLLTEQLNLGNVYVGGNMLVDGQFVSDKQISDGFLERHS